MKNIHLLPTEKLSRLYKSKITQNIFISNIISQHGDATYNQHLYITSDEEIKEGDWYYWIVTNMRIKAIRDNLGRLPKFSDGSRKIILTTDSTLIADGVQAIDDEFLEWFVKNPSCEKVEVEKRYSDFTVDPFVGYKIIIPQEEHKQETLTYTEAAKKEERIFNSTMMSKQETLEEAANRLFYTVGNEGISSIDSFMKGANYQSERMYSEEEVLDLLYKRDLYLFNRDETKELELPNEWFEQFKNKK